MKFLHNRYDQKTLLEKLKKETEPRITVSFYRYMKIEEPSRFRDELYESLFSLGVLGRIYIASEGINSQLSVPKSNFDNLKNILSTQFSLDHLRFNIALEESHVSFLKLTIKVRSKIVADGLEEDVDPLKTGRHLSPLEFHKLAQDNDTIVIDMRNHYEFRVGHFKNAILPDATTFREELPKVRELLKGKEDKKVLMYCTGGIRCEKASAYLKKYGFQDVNQLEGGVINYVNQIKDSGENSAFLGKNFVFDGRLGERVTNDILTTCDSCGKEADTHRDCNNLACHTLFVQCDECFEKLNGCCSVECLEFTKLPEEVQKEKRRLYPVGLKKKYSKEKRNHLAK
jgi:UPF0176 protein